MKRSHLLTVLLPATLPILLLLPAQYATAASAMKAGLWEVHIDTSMSGAARFQRPRSIRQCLTDSDIKNAARKLFSMSQPGTQCTIRNKNSGKEILSWDMRCESAQSEIYGQGRIRVSGEDFSGTIELHVSIPAANTTLPMKQTVSGHRISDC